MSSNSYANRAEPTVGAAIFFATVYLLACVVGFGMLRTRLAMPAGSELSLPRSVFTIANAASLTGFAQTIPIDSYKRFGQVVIFAMILCGSLTSMIIGGCAVVRIIRLPYSTQQIVTSALFVQALATIGGATILVSPQRGLFESIFQATSAFANCGVVVGPVGSMAERSTQMLILPLSVLGGLGLPVLMELVDAIRVQRRFSAHARTVLVATAAIYLVATVVLSCLNWPEQVPVASTPGREFKQSLLSGSTGALNSRSLGWAVDSPAGWPRSMTWIVMILMLIGASPAGTGGGLKTTTIVELARGTLAALRSRAVLRIFGIAILWAGAYLLLILLTTLRLVTTEPQLPADQILFIATSAVGNVGLAQAPVSITGDGLYALSAAMVLGRVLPLAILWWTALTTRDADLAVG